MSRRRVQRLGKFYDARHRPEVPFFLFLLGILFTAFAAFYVARTANSKDKIQFENSVDRMQRRIQDSTQTYTAILLAGGGFFAGSEYVSPREFRSFINTLQLRKRYPSAQGVGYVMRIAASQKDQLFTQIRLENPQFTLYPDSQRSEYYPIVYLEPRDKRNDAAIGYDMFTESVRREAMETARDTGQPAASGRVILVQETETVKQAGFLIYVPLYAKGQQPTTVQERRDTLIGFVYGPFRTGDFLQGILQTENLHYIDFQVYDGEKQDENHLLYDSNLQRNTAYTPRFSAVKKVNVEGQVWTIYFSNRPELDLVSEYHFIPFIFALGFSASAILYIITKSQYRARTRAEQAAAALRSSRETLRESEAKYRQVVESTSDLIVTLSPQAKIEYVSPSWQTVLGFTRQTLIGRNVFSLLHPDDRNIARAEMQKAAKGRIGKARIRLKHKKGHYLIFEGVGKALLTKMDKPRLFIATLHDVTKHVELEQRKDDFISIASHELKTPVTSMKIYSQLLHRQIEPLKNASVNTYLAKMISQIDKLTSLIVTLLDISRMQGGKMQFAMKDFNINKTVKDAVEIAQAMSKKHQIIVSGKVRRDFFGDEERISQVLTNLLTNAVKYSPEASKVEIKVTETNQELRIAVRDFGIGISEEHQDKIFQRFYRVTDEKQGTFPGLGIGLYVSSEIIKRHGGTLQIASSIGKGSIFTMVLPKKKTDKSER